MYLACWTSSFFWRRLRFWGKRTWGNIWRTTLVSVTGWKGSAPHPVFLKFDGHVLKWLVIRALFHHPLAQAINTYVLHRVPVPSHKQHLTVIPNQSMEEFYLPLSAFNMSSSAKNGCGECLKQFVCRFPTKEFNLFLNFVGNLSLYYPCYYPVLTFHVPYYPAFFSLLGTFPCSLP